MHSLQRQCGMVRDRPRVKHASGAPRAPAHAPPVAARDALEHDHHHRRRQCDQHAADRRVDLGQHVVPEECAVLRGAAAPVSSQPTAMSAARSVPQPKYASFHAQHGARLVSDPTTRARLPFSPEHSAPSQRPALQPVYMGRAAAIRVAGAATATGTARPYGRVSRSIASTLTRAHRALNQVSSQEDACSTPAHMPVGPSRACGSCSSSSALICNARAARRARGAAPSACS